MGGASSKGSPFPITNFQDKLLVPPDDDSVCQTWTILRSAIDAHARSRFYHSDRLSQPKEVLRAAVREHGIATDLQDADDLATLLLSPRHRRMGLRICIARVMVGSIDFYGDPDETSLDPAVVELMTKFERLRPDLGPEEENALAAWRMITAFFLQPAAQDLRSTKHAAVHTLERFLTIFVRDPDEEEARVTALQTLANRAIELGEKLFCHGARWIFEWRRPDDHPFGVPSSGSSGSSRSRPRGSRRGGPGRRDIVLFPALLRSDEEGHRQRGSLKYVVIKRKAVSGGAFFDVVEPPSPAIHVEEEDSSSSSSSSSDESAVEAAPRGRRRTVRK